MIAIAIAELDTAIRSAFEMVELAGDQAEALRNLDQRTAGRVKRLIARATSRFEIDYDDDETWPAVSVLTPKSFHYFLPAILCFCLRGSDGMGLEEVIARLLPAEPDYGSVYTVENKAFIDQISLTSPEQRQAIAYFWLYLREAENSFTLDESLPRISHFWDGCL